MRKALNILIPCVCLLAVAASFITLRSGSVESVQTSGFIEPESDEIAEFKLEREQLRAMQVAQLNDIVHGENTDQETRTMAQRQLLSIMDSAEKENTIEGVLVLRGFDDAVCTVHADSVNVMFKTEALTAQQNAVILDLVLRETGVTGGNVKVIPIN